MGMKNTGGNTRHTRTTGSGKSPKTDIGKAAKRARKSFEDTMNRSAKEWLPTPATVAYDTGCDGVWVNEDDDESGYATGAPKKFVRNTGHIAFGTGDKFNAGKGRSPGLFVASYEWNEQDGVTFPRQKIEQIYCPSTGILTVNGDDIQLDDGAGVRSVFEDIEAAFYMAWIG